ncbi:type VI secretion system baseplate subunit TssE [Aquincola sp. S2]|uniref:Type VI secretion system baseplate subunit TssE n=1 Tax=Pseudaquabacterium terrae TaxID=2732868 RepID=A0ABX2ELB7_9BURK|nr:type VI secretion system baseplate subunit TssE [Aquabacterium terrae]NRF69438.1 type VI secretion system baseplate subunit TssE [Aquabacterium terrae]
MNTFAPSLLDKLLGEGTALRGGGTAPRFTVEQVKDSVARDIEMLLNTHAPFELAELDGLPLVGRSLLTLGLTDISSLSLASDRDRARITEALRKALADHDKRLTQVEVKVRATQAGFGGLVFSIRAKLLLQPNVEPVSFDAVLQPGSNRYAVSKAARPDPLSVVRDA